MEIHVKKNEALEITFPMVNTTSPDEFDTGETVADTAYYHDGGSWTTLGITDTVTEISTTGVYQLSLTAAEMNHDVIMIKLTSTNAADSLLVFRTYTVDVDDLVRSTTPANTLAVDGNDRIDVGSWLGTAVTLSGNGQPEVDMLTISNSVTSAANAENFFNGTGFDAASSTIGTITTYTGNTPQTANHTAAIADIPTVSEFNARTIPTADYFDPDNDAVANVTLTATTTDVTNGVTASTVSDKTGYSIADSTSDAVIAGAVWDALTANYGIADSYGALIEAGAGGLTAAQVWDYDISGVVTADFAGTILNGVPNTSEFEARTIVAANYVVTSDTIAGVTTATNLTNNNDKTGYALIADSSAVTIGTVNTLSGHTAQTTDHTAGIAAIPNTSEFNARTLVAGSYFDPTADTVANVTAVATLNELGTSALADLFLNDSGTTFASAVSGSVVKEVADNAGGSSLTVDDIADGVWEEAISEHNTGTTFGGKNQKVVPSETINDYKATGFSTHAATDIVSSGAITTSSGAVSTVTTTVNLTNNNDKTGYTVSTVSDKTGYSLAADQSAVTIGTVTTNTDVRGTDSALLAANVPTNFSDLAIAITTGRVTVGTNADKTGYDLSADQSAVTVGNITNDVGITQAGADKAWGTAARTLTASTNFNDLSAADVLSEINDALDTAFTDATSLNTNGLKQRIRSMLWILRNKMEVVNASGNTIIYKDDSVSQAININTALTDDSTTTTRLRLA